MSAPIGVLVRQSSSGSDYDDGAYFEKRTLGWNGGRDFKPTHVAIPISPDALREMRERIVQALIETNLGAPHTGNADAILALIVPETHEGAA